MSISEDSSFCRVQLYFCMLLICASNWLLSADTATITQVGQGVVYEKYTYDNLYNSKQVTYVIDVNLNDPAIALEIGYLTDGNLQPVSAFASGFAESVAAINGTFFDSTGSLNFLKVNGTIITLTKPGVHDHQGITDDGLATENSINIVQRPAAGWSDLSTPNVITCGPDLVKDGLKVTNYDTSDPFITDRHPRTCAGWTYNNHLLLVVVDGRSTSAAGMSIPELRDYLFSLDEIRNGFNFDGGGSSTMWAGGSVVNVPSDGSERSVANAVVITAPAPALPAPPTGLTATAGSGEVSLTWNVSSGAMSYDVKRATVTGGPYSVVGSAADTSYRDTTALNGTTYYYVVSAINDMGESGNSSEASATPQCDLLAAPTELKATPGDSQVALTWNSVSTATSYNLKRSTTAGGPYSLLANLTSTSHTDTTAANGTTYYYVVSAVNACVESPDSAEVSATPKGVNNAAAVSISAPASVNVGESFSATVTMNNNGTQPWSSGLAYRLGSQNPQDNSRWGLHRVELPFSPVNPGQDAAFTFTATAPTTAGTYAFDWKMVQDGVEWFGAINASTITVLGPAPDAPSNLTATGQKRKISLSWTQSTSPNITSNKIYRSESSSGPYSLIATISANTSYTDMRLPSGATYFYTVTAVNDMDQESDFSNYAGATVQ